jgi:hypothetical protein
LATPEVINENLDGHLVRVTGMSPDTAVQDAETRLVLQADKAVLEAVLGEGSVDGGPDHWVQGSRLAVTGVYEIQPDEYRRPRAFQVRLRSLRDVQVLSRPSWWTVRRALTVTGGLALCTALGIGWVLTLRRQLRRQAAQIRA